MLLLQGVLGSPFAVLLATFAFFISLVPMIGSVIVWILGSVSLLLFNPVAALIFAIVYLVYMQFEAYFIGPRIMGKAVAVPGVLIIIGAMAGAALLGLLGALVAIPVVASGLIIIRKLVIPLQDAKTEAPAALD